jgi:iron complex outermembrane receptor protein
VKTSGFALANLNMQYDFSDSMSVNFGVRNIFDKNYELTEGFPEPGRSFYLKTRLTF